jgi:alpha-1,2-mannosyltransferase
MVEGTFGVPRDSRGLPIARVAARHAVFVLLIAGPVFLIVDLLTAAGHHPTDFATFWQSGRAFLHGRSPYPALDSLPRRPYPTFAPFVYPPITAALMAPLAVLPYSVAIVVFVAIDVAAIPLSLRLLGVRDWRCYGIALGSAPVFVGSALGTISPLLLLGVAAAWRYRDKAVRLGLLVAFVATAKVFLWPIWLWLVRTRRFRAAATAASVSAAALLCSWAAIGFAGLHTYPRLLGRLTGLEGPESYSLYSLGRSLGLGGRAAEAVVYLAGALAVAVLARRTLDSRRLLIAAIGVSLLLTPILWPHYLVLLFVPIALARPYASPIWLAPLALWADTTAWSHGSPGRIAVLLAITAATLLGAARLLDRDERPAVAATNGLIPFRPSRGVAQPG